ncbi:MAG TPA: hypothetical protein VN048_13275 [Verrucomicrobiae bacterium]|nr:hypothetical protein [Verrucomicrobiae bacterium]
MTDNPVNSRSFAKISITGLSRLATSLGLLLTACRLQAADPSINWISDSYSSFNVVLSGTGPGWSGTVTSPSGLWQLLSANVINLTCPTPTSSLVAVDNAGNATFLGQLPAQFSPPNPSAVAPFNAASIGTYGGYTDYFSPAAPISDENSLVYGYLHELSNDGPYQDWSGMSTITITSMPNPDNIATWTWTARYAAWGENLDAPEPGTISFAALAAVLGTGCMFCKSSKSHGGNS